MQTEYEILSRKIGRHFQKALTSYKLLENGDKILVGLSGGKDSLLLLELLAKRSKINFPKFTVEALHVRMKNVNYESDSSYLEKFSEDLGVKLHIKTTEFDSSTDKRKSPCFLCSWYRRKVLFNFAQENSFNKIALGHHQDDIINTALINLTFQGHFSSMPASLKMKKMPITIIRPLCLIQEKDIKKFSEFSHYEKQIKLCPFEHDSHRESIKNLFKSIEEINPEARYSIWHALDSANLLIE